ncbi:MAG: hypothetical protein R3B48_26675 [Kofleriaceae bacterium]
MSARPDAAAALPAVTALSGDAEFSMFEVVSFEGKVLRVHTPFALALGEELALKIEGQGRTTARVTGHVRSGEREVTELTLAE